MASLSPLSKKYMLFILHYAHSTYQFPLIWMEKSKKFIVDESPVYNLRSKSNLRLFLLTDIGICPVVLGVAISTRMLNTSFLFFLFVCFVLTVTLMNVVIDVITITQKKDCVQLLNSFLNYLKGNS